MGIQLKLLDHFKLTNHLGINFACSYSEDDRFFIINDIGIYILGFTGSVENVLPRFLCAKYFLNVSNFTPSNYIDLDINSFHNSLPKEDVYELVMKSEYSANLNYTKPIEPLPVYAEWSPRGLTFGDDCLLGVLTNLHSLEVYIKYLDETEQIQHVMISNITQHIIGVEKQEWKSANRLSISMKLEEYKRRIQLVSPTAFTWSHSFKIHGINASVIFVGHLNGDISLWRLQAIDFKLGELAIPTFLGRYHTQLQRITTMYWHRSSEFGGALFFADVDGRLNVVHATNLHECQAQLDKEQQLMAEPDKIKVDKISLLFYKEYTFILIVKQRVLVIFGLNQLGDIFDMTSVYIQEYYITGLHHSKNKIIVLSLPGILTELTIDVKNNEILVDKSLISLKYDMVKYRTHGFFFSKNMVLMCIIGYPWDLQSFSKVKTYVNVFVYHNILLKPFELLWNNEADTIKDHWDCFEVLRIICLKEKRFPWLGVPNNINYDSLSVTKLKTLRLVAKLSETVFTLIPTVKTYEIKPFIILHYLLEIKLVVQRMAALLRKSKKNELTNFEMRSLCIQNFFLKEMVAKNILPKANVGKIFINEIISVMEIANVLEYPEPIVCAWCGDKIFGPSCFPPHSDSRCCITMMPIFIVPDYKCFYCKSVAYKSIIEETFPIVCPYCDIVMDKLNMNDEKLRENCEIFQNNLASLKYSDCFQDCLKENIDYDEIEENTTEYVIFSDSDEDIDYMNTLYEKFSKTQISETSSTELVEVE